ncbi:MAG: DinB family protein [Mucilaginibacter sp.]
MNPLIETWQIHNRINIYLLESIDEKHLKDVSSSKGRNVGEQFAHVHNVRRMWLKVADASLLEGLSKIDRDSITKNVLLSELQLSGKVIGQLFERSENGKIRGFKPHATAFLGYLVSHESHHRGQIILALKQSGHPVDQKVQYGLWEWGVR